MILLNLCEDDLNKADIPGSKVGLSDPRPGHKWIDRIVSPTGQVEYIYEHPDHAFQQNHLDPGIHHTNHPKTGDPIQLHVRDKGNKQSIHVRPEGTSWSEPLTSHTRTSDNKWNRSPNQLVEGTPTHSGGFSSAQSINKWYNDQKQSKTVTDAKGIPLYNIEASVPKSQDVKFKGRWTITIPENSPMYRSGKDRYARTSAEDAERLGQKIIRNLQKLQESSQRSMFTQLSQEGITPTVALENDLLPLKVDENRPIATKVSFSTPEEEQSFIQSLYQENIEVLKQQADRLTNDPEIVNIKNKLLPEILGDGQTAVPGSIPYKIISAALNSYDPDLSTPFKNYLGSMASYLYKKTLGSYSRNLGYQSYLNVPEGQSLDSAIEKELLRNNPERVDSIDENVDLGPGKDIESQELSEWTSRQSQKLDQWAQQDPNAAKYAEAAKNELTNITNIDERRHILNLLATIGSSLYTVGTSEYNQFITNVLDQEGLGKSLEFLDITGNYLIQKAVESIVTEQDMDQKMEKAVSKVPPPMAHNYSHSEGSSNNPKHYYSDDKGNLVRYTNAPKGHPDNAPFNGDPEIHPSEPQFESNPEYFTQDGRKLFRAPTTGSDVEWNPNYHPENNQNLWAGRWVNPVTGDFEYTYLDKDVKTNPALRIHRINILMDTRIAFLRKSIWSMFKSPQIKDQIMALALILLDQGRMKAMDLAMLTPEDVAIRGNLVLLGDKILTLDTRLSMMIKYLSSGEPGTPVFSIPYVNQNGSFDMMKMRRIGLNLMSRALDNIGIPLEALQMYHSTQTYSLSVQRLLGEGLSYEAAHHYALLDVASSIGHDLNQEDDVQMALYAIQSYLIDPIVIRAIQKNANDQQLGVSGETQVQRLQEPIVPYINSELTDKTPSEQEFSKYLHSVELGSLLG